MITNFFFGFIMFNLVIIFGLQYRRISMKKLEDVVVFCEMVMEVETKTLINCAEKCLDINECTFTSYTKVSKRCSLFKQSNQSLFTGNKTGSSFYQVISDGTTRITNPSSCAQVKQCQPNAVDGEYWIYPDLYGNEQKIKIYCHNMTSSSGSSEEYVTLPDNTNTITKHTLNHLINNWECTRNLLPLMQVTFSKVRLNIDTMEVLKKDYTFTQVSGLSDASTIGIGYGESSDCSGHSWTTPCQRYGELSIDLTGTGLTIDASIQWRNTGYASKLVQYTRSTDQIYCLAGGWCGGCKPNDTIKLIPVSNNIPQQDASTVLCYT